MPRFCANLTMMFNEVPFLDRFEAAAKAGFKAVEFLFPYDFPASEIKARLEANGLEQILFNMPPGDWAAGDRGTACLPGRTDEFRSGVEKALEYAGTLGCKTVHCMSGLVAPDMTSGAAANLYAINLAWAAEQASSANVMIVIEPINKRDMPKFLLKTTDQAADVIAAIGYDRVRLLFDIYHTQISEGDVATRMATLLPIIGHIQIADVPSRNEPGTGEIGWRYIFQKMAYIEYSGWVGCEYRPATTTLEGLGWLQTLTV